MNTDILNLKTISPTGRPPEMRLSDPDEAAKIVSILKEGNKMREGFDAKVKGQMDGNPPYDSGKLRGLGQAYRTNINWMEAKAVRSSAMTPYYDLFAGARYFAEVALEHDDPDTAASISKVVTEEFDQVLKSWKGMIFQMHSSMHDFVVFGKGYVMWPGKGWRFKYIPKSKFLVPDGTMADIDCLEIVVMRECLKSHQLYEEVANSDSARAAGWKVSEVHNAIRRAIAKDSTGTPEDYQAVQNRMNEHDLYEGLKSEVIEIAHLFVREFSGKITHLIIEERSPKSQKTSSDGESPAEHAARMNQAQTKASFLFSKKNRYESFRQAIGTFFLETQDGTWNGSYGLGKDIYAMVETKNRLRCQAVDLTFLRGGITLQAKTPNAHQNASLVQAGPLNLIPQGWDVQQATILGDVDGQLKMDRTLDIILSRNTGIYQQRPQKEDGNPITATEATINKQDQVVLTNSAVMRFYSQLDHVMEETYRRLVNMEEPMDERRKNGEEWKAVEKLKKKCKERGVEAGDLKKFRWVRAFRNIGNGSIFMRQQAVMQMFGIAPMLPESGKQNFMEDAIAAITSHEMVARYFPRAEKSELPSDDMAFALLENAAMKLGAPVTWTPTQNNVIHAQTHLQAGAQAAASLKDPGVQQNFEEVLVFLDAIGSHVAIHLAQFENDSTRKQEHAVLTEQWKQLAGIADKLRQQMERLSKERDKKGEQDFRATMDQRMAEGGMDPAMQLESQRAHHEMGLKEFKANEQMRLKQEKQAFDQALKDAETAENIARKRREQMATS